MKLIVEVNKEDLDFIRKTFAQNSHDYIPTIIRNRFTDAVLNGTPIPDNATNGDVFSVIYKDILRTLTVLMDDMENIIATNVNIGWWNAPYKRSWK